MLYDIKSTAFTRINYFGSHPLLTIVCYRKVLCIIDRCYLSNYFSLNKILRDCFASYAVFWSDTDNWTFCYCYPVHMGFWSDFLFTCYLVSIATLARNFIAVYTLLLCILQGLHPSGLILILPESKICFLKRNR